MTRHTGGARCSPSQVDHGDTKGFLEPLNVEGLLEESGTSLNELSHAKLNRKQLHGSVIHGRQSSTVSLQVSSL